MAQMGYKHYQGLNQGGKVLKLSERASDILNRKLEDPEPQASNPQLPMQKQDYILFGAVDYFKRKV